MYIKEDKISLIDWMCCRMKWLDYKVVELEDRIIEAM